VTRCCDHRNGTRHDRLPSRRGRALGICRTGLALLSSCSERHGATSSALGIFIMGRPTVGRPSSLAPCPKDHHPVCRAIYLFDFRRARGRHVRRAFVTFAERRDGSGKPCLAIAPLHAYVVWYRYWPDDWAASPLLACRRTRFRTLSPKSTNREACAKPGACSHVHAVSERKST
jgi:hypothetical protein